MRCCGARAGADAWQRTDGRGTQGAEAVFDKDRCSALTAAELQADCPIIATDAAAVCLGWRLPTQRAVGRVAIGALRDIDALLAGGRGTQITAGPA